MGEIIGWHPVRNYKRKRVMGKLFRVGMGFLAGAAAAAVIYEIARERSNDKRLVMPGVKRGKLVRFPAERPPFAEAAESSAE